jgi:hypothetical protein
MMIFLLINYSIPSHISTTLRPIKDLYFFQRRFVKKPSLSSRNPSPYSLRTNANFFLFFGLALLSLFWQKIIQLTVSRAGSKIAKEAAKGLNNAPTAGKEVATHVTCKATNNVTTRNLSFDSGKPQGPVTLSRTAPT